jgi:hypothetical protein
MIAYNTDWLDHLEMHDALDEGFRENWLGKEEWENGKKKFPVGFYTPNGMVRIGLFLLTLVIAIFSFAILSVIFNSSSGYEKGFGVLSIITSLFCYTGLELVIRRFHHYRSGVDDALLIGAILFLVTGLNLIFSISSLGNSLILLIVSSYFSLRFKDGLMSALVVLSFFSTLFYLYLDTGELARMTAPFLIMASAVGLYFFIHFLSVKPIYRHYANCFSIGKIVALVSFYAAGNYYLVGESGNYLFHLGLQKGDQMTFGWVFWLFTIFVPLFYMTMGARKKDIVLLRCGLILMLPTVLTIRNYFHFLPAELALVIAGTAMILFAYGLIRYLKIPKHGFSSVSFPKKEFIGQRQVEALVIAETFGVRQPTTSNAGHTEFGGGSGGGGGAGGEF